MHGIRTRNLLIRSQVRCPLRQHIFFLILSFSLFLPFPTSSFSFPTLPSFFLFILFSSPSSFLSFHLPSSSLLSSYPLPSLFQGEKRKEKKGREKGDHFISHSFIVSFHVNINVMSCCTDEH